MNSSQHVLENVRVKTLSPDRTISVTYAFDRGMTVKCRRDHMGGHSESSLAQQIQHALTGALSGYREAKTKAVEREFGQFSSAPHSNPAAESLLARVRRTQQLLANIDVTGKSPRSAVEIRLHATNGFTVTIAPHTLSAHGATTVIEDVNSALRDTFSRYRRQADEIHERCHTKPIQRGTGAPA